jgi:hypothetical protein
MEKLESFWNQYKKPETTTFTGIAKKTNYTYSDLLGVTCPVCGVYVSGNRLFTYPNYYIQYQQIDIEKSFQILKMLVKEKIIQEPAVFEEFCELLEKIKNCL